MHIGELAPDFKLPLHTGEEFRLSKYRGAKNVVLYFYPRDFTVGCTKQGCLFSSHTREIERFDAIIVGISADSIEMHRQFVQEYGLTFPLASDVDREVCRQYDAQWFHGIGIRRVTYVVDKKGIIRGKIHHELFINRHWIDVLRALGELERSIANG